jgi:hypothetical protein
MKKSASILLVTLVLGASCLRPESKAAPPPQSIDHGGTIEAKYDGFTKETVIALRKMRISCEKNKTTKDTCISLAASLHAPGKQLDYVRSATLQIIFETKNWDSRHALDQRELAVVANGETLRLGRMGLVKQDVDTNRLIDVMREVLEVSVPYQTFQKIASAEYVEMRVGNSEFALREKNIAALRDLNNRVKF